jgi:hypothetical protein
MFYCSYCKSQLVSSVSRNVADVWRGCVFENVYYWFFSWRTIELKKELRWWCNQPHLTCPLLTSGSMWWKIDLRDPASINNELRCGEQLTNEDTYHRRIPESLQTWHTVANKCRKSDDACIFEFSNVIFRSEKIEQVHAHRVWCIAWSSTVWMNQVMIL